MNERTPPSGPDADLDARKEQVLRAVVEEFIASAEPVGSQKIAGSHDLGVSSATVRNAMAALERDGFLTQPHTSAGRVPTDKGYRYFVDHLTRVEALGPPHADTVSRFFAGAEAALDEILHETSQILSRITDHAALVVGPAAASATVMSIQLVPLHADVLLAVAVLSNGVVEKGVVKLAGGVGDGVVRRASGALADAAIGSPLGDLTTPPATGDAEADDLAARASEALGALVVEHAGEPVFVGGASHLAAEAQDFAAVDTAARLLELLEQQFLVVSLARNIIDRGTTVRIGAENEQVELRECSVVLAPVQMGQGVAGTVGILGPTRMDYRRAIAAVATVSESLGRHLDPS